LSNIANTNIYFDSNPLSYWLEKNWIASSTKPSSYDSSVLSEILNNFVQKYAAYATEKNVLLKDWNIDTPLNKVPSEEVYYKNLEGGNVVFNEWLTFDKPTTIIIENWNVTLRPNIKWNLMLVVKNGYINIENQNMNTQWILEGYYITDKWFRITWPASTNGEILNYSPYQGKSENWPCVVWKDTNCQPYWFEDGRLLVNGALIWPNANNIYLKRRSLLFNRFNPNYGPARAIAHGASLELQSNVDLWTNPPIGSKDLFQMLDISPSY
jgi:hypothetical protein